jgi:hypothetical protein
MVSELVLCPLGTALVWRRYPWGYNGDPMPHPGTSQQTVRVERLVDLFGAANNIAPFDDAAFGKKVGELLARSASAGKSRKRRPAKVGRVDFASQALSRARVT